VLAAGVLLAHAPAAHATNFGVLLGGEGEDRVEYNINAPSSGPPEPYRPVSISLSFPALPGPGPFQLTFTDEEPAQVVPLVPGSYVFTLTVRDAAGDLVTALGAEAVFGFQYDPASVPEMQDACLSYLDESESPPRWECQDAALEPSCGGRDGFVCGTTDHLTQFAIGPVPEPSTALLLGLGGALLSGLRVRARWRAPEHEGRRLK
jgi:hypothetical protein